jgi:hypothetical protein
VIAAAAVCFAVALAATPAVTSEPTATTERSTRR